MRYSVRAAGLPRLALFHFAYVTIDRPLMTDLGRSSCSSLTFTALNP